MRSTFTILLILLFTSVRALDQQIATSPAGTEYLIYIPADYDGSTAYPMLVYLHGAQAINNDINISLNKGLPRVIRLNSWFANYPMIVVSPHLKPDPMLPLNDNEWDAADVDEVVQHIIDTYNIDEDRIHGSGISLGAKGIWDYALAYPTRMTGLVPIAGNADPTNICTLTDMALLPIHGENDNTIPIEGSKDGGIRFGPVDLITAIEACPASTLVPPHLLRLGGKSHGGWDEVYDLSSGYDIYEWLLMVEKGKSAGYAPMINLGEDQIILQTTDPFVIQSFAFDPNGSITNYDWDLLSGPAVTFTDGNPDLELSFTQTGTYQFRLTVTDDEALTNSDDIEIQVLASSTLPAVTGFRLYDSDTETDLGVLTDGSVISFADIGTENLDIEAIVTNLGTRASVRLSLENNRNFNTTNDNQGTFYSFAGERSNPVGDHLAFTPPLGNVTLTGTAYQDRNADGGSGVTFQITVEVMEESNPLPVDFLRFDGKSDIQGIALRWLTTNEVDNSHFEIHRGTSLDNIRKIAEIFPKETEEAIKQYEYLDREVSPGTYYYKLRNVDLDGSHQDYKIITVRHFPEGGSEFSISPNPVSGNWVNIRSNTGKQGRMDIHLFDLQGRIIREWTINDFSTGKFPVPTGNYVLRLTTATTSKSFKLIVK